MPETYIDHAAVMQKRMVLSCVYAKNLEEGDIIEGRVQKLFINVDIASAVNNTIERNFASSLRKFPESVLADKFNLQINLYLNFTMECMYAATSVLCAIY